VALRVLILTNRVPYPLNDGGALSMDVFLKGFPEAGCTTRLLAMNTARHRVDEALLPKLYPQLEQVVTVPVDNRVKPLPLFWNWLFGREPYHVSRFRSDAFAQALTAQLRAFKPQVVHVESPFLASYLPLIRQYAPAARTVLRMNNVEAEIWARLAQVARPLVKRYYLKSLAQRMAAYERKIWPLFDALLPITASDAQAVAGFMPADQIRMVPFLIDTTGVESAPLPQPFKAYHLAAMDWLPNVEAVRWAIEEVWPHLQAGTPGLELWFGGRHMPAHLVQLAGGNLHVEGEVPDAAAFLRDKAILVVPLRAGSGIRVKILEAMAAGKVVVSTRVGMQGIEVTNGVEAVLADTPADFAAAVTTLYQNPERAQQIADAGRAFVTQNFDRRRAMAGLVEWLKGLSREVH
jgi:glycosyltransferase involved in cell wall biosynthesis